MFHCVGRSVEHDMWADVWVSDMSPSLDEFRDGKLLSGCGFCWPKHCCKSCKLLCALFWALVVMIKITIMKISHFPKLPHLLKQSNNLANMHCADRHVSVIYKMIICMLHAHACMHTHIHTCMHVHTHTEAGGGERWWTTEGLQEGMLNSREHGFLRMEVLNSRYIVLSMRKNIGL